MTGVEICLEGLEAVLHVSLVMTDEQLCALVAGLPLYAAQDWVKVWVPRDGAEPLARRLERN